MSNISIIIPTLNEAQNIEHLLNALAQRSSSLIKEIIIVDGGSTDQTVAIVNRLSKTNSKLKLVASNKGRPIQLNKGASVATSDILYFLHADSIPPQNFDRLIANQVSKGHEAGCFKMKFDSPHLWLKFLGWLTQFSWRAGRGGDQSQFITKPLFQSIGGYDERYLIYEDNILINQLYKRKQFVVIPKWLVTSSRRFYSVGILKLQLHFWAIYFKKWMGASPEELHLYHRKYLSR
ncbi:MAG: glycosyl transferase family 2 [Bacteroidetes bacterium MedPE-SWsnd-G2]|nr:MAG: glycosyl transferase family 2 [Bacteroidetes bacterium MedPE-SWsnd-G2]